MSLKDKAECRVCRSNKHLSLIKNDPRCGIVFKEIDVRQAIKDARDMLSIMYGEEEGIGDTTATDIIDEIFGVWEE